ncbi:MAG: response regulator [Planctomycetes bacterium]|nr:response regulator [Planctomycetota bacterium]
MPANQHEEVLLVEDNSADAEMTVWALEKNQLSRGLHRVKNGAEALTFLFPQGEPATAGELKVVILDIKLPLVDGIEVLKRMKSDPALKLVPVVILTSSSEPADRAVCYDLGVNSYVVKPLEFEEFVSTVGLLARYWLKVNCSRA